MTSTATPRHRLAIASLTRDELYHTIRNPDGSWQETFGLVENQVSGGPETGFAGSGCAGVEDVLELIAVGTDARLYHTIRNADGTWQTFFGLVEGQVSGGPQNGFTAVACGGVGDELQVVALGFDSQLYHTIRNGDGSWQAVFGLVEGQVHAGPPSFRRIACGGAGQALHVIGLGSDGQLYHTLRASTGTWQSFFGLVEGQVHGGPARFTAAGCAGVGASLHVVGLGSDGQLYHTIRDPNGTWQDFFGLVEGQVHAGPPSFTGVSCGGVADSLHLVGSTFNGGFL